MAQTRLTLKDELKLTWEDGDVHIPTPALQLAYLSCCARYHGEEISTEQIRWLGQRGTCPGVHPQLQSNSQRSFPKLARNRDPSFTS